ncbi:hypothetical protein GOPIP_061_00520 [Gordonia polyisoprenivorans NBRC 16320 = JCM 10675]|uniref:Uncharacterized protein n=1 Tax=Gordonia polyisoprenivorans TaxID=84595 RepID=A0A846WJL3_9ACTN|nr:hypothetical protein [Gordonia polyisoprenivorans]NKY01864.1 hypothetical protein [Gordonia polyisoprenivorans]GAB24045.1 hypothetical protein GOPIP_061_00520 [Gordonia polyisoprenivorans NBRC 16320 = JCM 10675]
MNTTTDATTTHDGSARRNGPNFWKVLGIIAIVLIALAMLGPILKGLFWIGLIGLAVYGAIMLLRASRSKGGPTSSGF